MLPGMELMACPNLAVPRDVMHHVVRVESSYNPYAIGVVGGRLQRQPRSLPEAVSTVRMLEARGYNFSLGLAQVNRYNLAKYGLDSYEKAFQPCANLVAGSRILGECYGRSGGDWGKSFSCYYSGDFRTGYRHGYVQKVYASMRNGTGAPTASVAPIEVIDRAPRRVAVNRSPAAFAVAATDVLAARRGARHQAAPLPQPDEGAGAFPTQAMAAARPDALPQAEAIDVAATPQVVGRAVPTFARRAAAWTGATQTTTPDAMPAAAPGDSAFVF